MEKYKEVIHNLIQETSTQEDFQGIKVIINLFKLKFKKESKSFFIARELETILYERELNFSQTNRFNN